MIDYENLEHIDVKDFFLQEEDEYFVYLYFTYCPHCNLIKERFLKFASDRTELNIKFICMDGENDADLFFNTQRRDDESRDEFINRYIKESIGKDKVSEVNYYFVPSLYKIKDGKVIDIKVGEDDILDLLDTL